MFGVCFCREPKSWMQDQWSHVFSNFGVRDLWELGKDKDDSSARGKDGSIYQPTIAIDTADELPLNVPLVVLAPQEGRYVQGEQSLVDFVHPEDAIYLFGGSHTNLSEVELGSRIPDHIVYIPTVRSEMYAHAAGYITLYDRMVKRG